MSLGPQMSMHTTLDLVLLLLDDLDAGRDIDRLRTEQLRAALLSSDGARRIPFLLIERASAIA